ncbi:MAG: integrase core domain-containing protein [Bacteroidales bacterium]|nr:integrase core domain-containing protein [Bacteroidales bacterium]
MDGKGRWIDNVFIERFWRSIKYEKIYLEPSEDGNELYGKIKWYMEFYNARRPHQSLEYNIPEQVYGRAACMDILPVGVWGLPGSGTMPLK